MKRSKIFYLTTAIDYVNALPHLGTAYEKVGADVLARYMRLKGVETFFQMGVDEHSQNVEKEARKAGLSPKDYCDQFETKFLEVWKKLDISFDQFLRTTDDFHVEAIQRIFQTIYDKGDIYKGFYEGWYCVSCENFLQEKELDEGSCPVHKTKPQWIREENYFFALSRYSKKLEEYINNNPDFIRPGITRREILNVIKGGLSDISVSRSSIGWGIPLPFDTSHVVYVWFDALCNYISGVGFYKDPEQFSNCWPANIHIIGKDITRFHCIIWPAILMSLGIELPLSVYGHGFVSLRGEKMSKTSGTLVNPVEAAEVFGVDSLRYYLMREIPFDKDGDFTWKGFQGRYESDLANDLGNLLNRVIAMITKYNEKIIPAPGFENDNDVYISNKAQSTKKQVDEHMNNLDFNRALSSLWELIQACNQYVEKTAPWNLFKDKSQESRLLEVLGVMAECLRRIGLLLSPFMPSAALEIMRQIGLDSGIDFGDLSEENFNKSVLTGKIVQKGIPLFPKKDEGHASG
ncbi:MAG: methionine--tRNA ligase [Candidatus Theseobacter exili]|nr:methionine--tRNA ligase [Candidatus Theseobacter exili]